MSKIIIECVCNFNKMNNGNFLFIPSRRQIDTNSGYVWTTKEFSEYVKGRALIERDHGGPSQGSVEDNGWSSLQEDCKYFNIIHLDPWKKYSDYEKGLQWTLEALHYCHSINSSLLFEVGTEEAIRPFTPLELRTFLTDLKSKLPSYIFDRIRYVVIQCGTRLHETSNIGFFNKEKCKEMIQIAKDFKIIPKEHNGDYVSIETLREKRNLGLNHINIAPELGVIQTKVLLAELDESDKNDFFNLCYKSDKWRKWVSPDFDPLEQKETLMHISGHYVFDSEEMKTIREKYKDLHLKIYMAIWSKLEEYNSI